MAYEPDLVIIGRDGALALEIEVKTARADTEWARTYRRNLVRHGYPQRAPFFLMATPGRFFLWKESDKTEPEAPPTHEAAMTHVLEEYLGPKLELESMDGYTFEMALRIWLESILRKEELPADANFDWLRESGLWSMIEGGRVSYGDPLDRLCRNQFRT